MSTGHGVAGIAVVSLLAGAATGWNSNEQSVMEKSAPSSTLSDMSVRRIASATALADAVRIIGLSPAFGVAEVANERENDTVVPASVPTVAPRRVAILRGVIGGPPWLAVVDTGAADQRPVIVSVGDSCAGGRVLRVSSQLLVLRRRDSLITLSVTDQWR